MMRKEEATFLIWVGIDMSGTSMLQNVDKKAKKSAGKEGYQHNFKLTAL